MTIETLDKLIELLLYLIMLVFVASVVVSAILFYGDYLEYKKIIKESPELKNNHHYNEDNSEDTKRMR